jgi:phospholipid transport system substrate-binding protein
MMDSAQRRRCVTFQMLWLGILCLSVILPRSLEASAGQPTDRVRDTLETALRILNDPAIQGPEHDEARTRRVRELIADRFNYAEMAERSLNFHWDKLTPQQRQDFVALFGELFERSYTRMVLQSLPDQRIMYTGESENGTRSVVGTVLVDARGDRLPVDYRLESRQGRWEMFDVIIDGVSIVANYQSQFNRIIQTSSFDSLVTKMRVKQEEE